MLALNQSAFIDNFYVGCKKGGYLFLTLKAPLLIFCTLVESILCSNIIYSAVKVSVGRSSFFKNVVIFPVIEEVIFRGVIQQTIKKIAVFSIHSLGIHKKESFETYQQRVNDTAYKITRIATSILFGLAHCPFGGVIQAVSAGLGGYFGESELMEKDGLTASIGCHISNNFASHLTMFVMNNIK